VRNNLTKKNNELSGRIQESENKLSDLNKMYTSVLNKKTETDADKGKLETQLNEALKNNDQNESQNKKIIEQNKNLLAEKQGLLLIKENLAGENARLAKLKQDLKSSLDKEQSERDHWYQM